MEQTTMFNTFDNGMTNSTRLITPAELANLSQVHRSWRGWSQETLAELTGLKVRTVQRVEAGQPSSSDTRRALARAFGVDDIDTFNKAHEFQTAEEFEAKQRKDKEDFERQFMTIDVQPMTGRGIARLTEGVFTACVELAESLVARSQVEDVYAELKDFVRDLIDLGDNIDASERLGYGDDLQRMLASLERLGCSVVGGRQTISLRWRKGIGTTGIYLFVVKKGEEPKVLAVPREQENVA